MEASCPLKFLHALAIDQCLLVHTANRVGVPQKFKGEHFKIGLKFSVLTPITLVIVKVSS